MKTIFSLLTLVSLSFFSFGQTSISISSSGFSPASIPFNGSTFSDFAPNSKLMEAAQNPNNGYLGKMNGITHGVGNITSFTLEIPSAKETFFGLQIYWFIKRFLVPRIRLVPKTVMFFCEMYQSQRMFWLILLQYFVNRNIV